MALSIRVAGHHAAALVVLLVAYIIHVQRAHHRVSGVAVGLVQDDLVSGRDVGVSVVGRGNARFAVSAVARAPVRALTVVASVGTLLGASVASVRLVQVFGHALARELVNLGGHLTVHFSSVGVRAGSLLLIVLLFAP